MMKLVYLINTKEYKYHKNMIEDFSSVIPGDILDMSDGTAKGSRYEEIRALDPDIVITFDLSGFELRTVSDTLSLNSIYARMAHILFHSTDHYGNLLKARQNLSMFTYVPENEDINACRSRYNEVPNIERFPKIDYKADLEEEHEANRRNIRSWWEEFRKEAMI